MAGAFVAVADDATATWWNPAGLASGAYFSAVIERGALDNPGTPAAGAPARRDTFNDFALAVPSLGISYYHLQVGEVQPLLRPIGEADAGRQDEGAAEVELRAVSLNRFAATVGQSIGNHFVLATSIGVLHGGAAISSEAAVSDSVSHALDVDVASETHADIDAGAMLSASALRLGVAVKHLTKPSFGSGDSALTLGRQARAGIAIVQRGAIPLTLAADLDLTKTPTVMGDAQHFAAGAELWLAQRRIGIRGGVSANVVGDTGTSASSGLSIGLKKSLFLDGALTFGSDTTRSGWAAGLRATF